MSIINVLIMMGVSGSGKTHISQRLAQDLNWRFFDADDFHSQTNIDKMRGGIPLTDADRAPWLDTLQTLIQDCIEQNQPAVLACSALKQGYRDRLRVDPSVKFVYLKGSYDLINQRLRNRADHFMAADLLSSQFEALEEPNNALVVDISLSSDKIIETIKNCLTSL